MYTVAAAAAAAGPVAYYNNIIRTPAVSSQVHAMEAVSVGGDTRSSLSAAARTQIRMRCDFNMRARAVGV